MQVRTGRDCRMDVTPVYKMPLGSEPTASASLSPAQVAENRETIQAVHAANEAELFGDNTELTFSIDRITGKIVIRLVNRKTRKEIRRISADELLLLSKSDDSANDG